MPVQFDPIQTAPWNAKKGIIVRGYSPLGLYPMKSFQHKDAAFVVGKDLVFSLVRFEDCEIDDYYLDNEWLSPFEIKLIGALTVSVNPFQVGKVFPYPLPWSIKVEDDSELHLGDENIWQDFEEFLKNKINETPNPFNDPTPLPAFASGQNYDLHERAHESNRQNEIFENIDIEDHLLIRGLGALVKGNLLKRHYIFHTEACISAHIAMEATLHLILRRLKKIKNNPSNEDASKYLAKQLKQKNYPTKYFEEYYEDRIKAVHPENRFGTFPDAPLSADDFYDLCDDLIGVYDFLITGNTEIGML